MTAHNLIYFGPFILMLAGVAATLALLARRPAAERSSALGAFVATASVALLLSVLASGAGSLLLSLAKVGNWMVMGGILAAVALAAEVTAWNKGWPTSLAGACLGGGIGLLVGLTVSILAALAVLPRGSDAARDVGEGLMWTPFMSTLIGGPTAVLLTVAEILRRVTGGRRARAS